MLHLPRLNSNHIPKTFHWIIAWNNSIKHGSHGGLANVWNIWMMLWWRAAPTSCLVHSTGETLCQSSWEQTAESGSGNVQQQMNLFGGYWENDRIPGRPENRSVKLYMSEQWWISSLPLDLWLLSALLPLKPHGWGGCLESSESSISNSNWSWTSSPLAQKCDQKCSLHGYKPFLPWP